MPYFDILYGTKSTTPKVTPQSTQGGYFGNLKFTQPKTTPEPIVTKPKPVSKTRQDFISQGVGILSKIGEAEYNIIQKVSKEPIIGKTLQIAKTSKDILAKTKNIAQEIVKGVVIDLYNVTKETAQAWADIPKAIKEGKKFKSRELSES